MSAPELKRGDEITVAVKRQGHVVYVARSTVHTVFPAQGRFFTQSSPDGRTKHNGYFDFADEGVTWVRGRHALASAEVVELLKKADAHYTKIEMAEQAATWLKR